MPPTSSILVDRFLSGLYQFRNFAEQGGANRGQVVEAMLKHVGLEPGQPWCMAMVSYVGYHTFLRINPATLEVKSDWPLPKTGGCAYMGDFAKRKGVLVREPQRGDVFLKYYQSKRRFAHTGVLIERIGDRWLTFEGNTNRNPEERDGWGAFFKYQTFKSLDAFVRWPALM